MPHSLEADSRNNTPDTPEPVASCLQQPNGTICRPSCGEMIPTEITQGVPDFTRLLQQKLQTANVENILIDRSEITLGTRLGAGAYGEVYRAKWRGAEVAYKCIPHKGLTVQGLEEFCREVSILASLRHPNIVLFLGVVVHTQEMGIVTQLVRQGSLYRILHKARVELSDQRRLAMALDTARGMNYLHTFKPPVVHRDLKSQNLLVDRDFSVKVCDFGLAQLKHSAYLSTMSDRGTPGWAAPEVLRGEVRDEKSDVYSFGFVLYELATGILPWDGMHTGQVFNAVANEHHRPELPADMQERTAVLIRRCWSEIAKERPTFQQILEELGTWDTLGTSTSALALNTAQASFKQGLAPSGGSGPSPVAPAGNSQQWHLVAVVLLVITAVWNALVMWAAVWQRMLSWQVAVTLFAVFAGVVAIATPVFFWAERHYFRHRGAAPAAAPPARPPVPAVGAPSASVWWPWRKLLPPPAARPTEVAMVPMSRPAKAPGDKGKDAAAMNVAGMPVQPPVGHMAMGTPVPMATPFTSPFASPFGCAVSPFAQAPSCISMLGSCPFANAGPSCIPMNALTVAVATLTPPCLGSEGCGPQTPPATAGAGAAQAPSAVLVSRQPGEVHIAIGPSGSVDTDLEAAHPKPQSMSSSAV